MLLEVPKKFSEVSASHRPPTLPPLSYIYHESSTIKHRTCYFQGGRGGGRFGPRPIRPEGAFVQ